MDRIKAIVAGLPAQFEALKTRWRFLGRVLGMLEHYGARRGNVYAAAISFIGILSLVPILMVTFAVAAFVLASRPEWIQDITDAVVRNVPGELGGQLNDVIDTAIDSRRTVGVVGLVSAALTGLGWMGVTRHALSDMWGGRRKRNAIMSKVVDLGMFVLLGLVFLVTIGLTVATTGPVGRWVLEFLGLDGQGWAHVLLRAVSIVVSVIATSLLFTVVLSQMPVQKVPMRAVFGPAVAIGVVIEVLKSFGAIYLRSVLSSPAGAAFGSVLGVMVFTYLLSRVVLYAAAWAASNPAYADYLITDEMEFGPEHEREHEPDPVVLAPVYEVSPAPKARTLAAAAGLGAAAGALLSRRRRD